MAGGPYKGSGGWYYIKWSDKRAHPDEPKKSESLKTQKLKEAKFRKGILEVLYREGKHDPWRTSWHNNPSLKAAIFGNPFETPISNIYSSSIPSLLKAIELYIDYKTPINPEKKASWQWNPDTTRPRQLSTLREFANFIGIKKPIIEITSDDIRKFISQETIQSEYTVFSYVRRINAFFSWCVDQKYISADQKPGWETHLPQADIPVFIYNDELANICLYKLDKVQDEIRRGVTKEENSQLYMPLAWLLLRFTGMRPIELRKLYLDAVDLTGQQIIIGKRRRGRTNRTKTGLQRIIPMNPFLLEMCRYVVNPQIRKHDQWMAGNDHLFGRPGRQSQKRLSLEFTKARRELFPDRPEITLYSLRDTFAVGYLTNPANTDNPMFGLYNLRTLLGHTSITTTEKYLKAIPHHLPIQRIQNYKIFYRILEKFYQSSIGIP